MALLILNSNTASIIIVNQLKKPHFSICLSSFFVMASPHTQTACGEHKLPIEEETNANGLKILKRAQWLRAAILGANDGLLSTTSLMLGVGAAKENQRFIILSGLAGAVAGACSMAVGEYVSVSTQRDIETQSKTIILNDSNKLVSKTNEDDVKLDIANPNPINLFGSPATTPLRSILSKRGNELDQSFEKALPFRVIEKKSPLIRDSPVSFYSPKSSVMKVIEADSKRAKCETDEKETEIEMLPNPYKAAVASALSFLFGSLFPLIPAILITHNESRIIMIIVVTSIALALFGGVGAYFGGSCVKVSAVRVLLGGWISMAITYGVLKPLDKDRKGDISE